MSRVHDNSACMPWPALVLSGVCLHSQLLQDRAAEKAALASWTDGQSQQGQQGQALQTSPQPSLMVHKDSPQGPGTPAQVRLEFVGQGLWVLVSFLGTRTALSSFRGLWEVLTAPG